MQDHSGDIAAYCDGVLDGSIVSGSLVKAAVRRHVADLETVEERGRWFDVAAANRAINVFACLSHTAGEYAGEPFILRRFQKFIIWNLFGWKREDGSRRFRKAFVSLARGNGKSPLGAGIANVLFRADDPPEPRAEVYALATKEKQARIVWEEATNQIRKSKSASLKAGVVIQKKNMHMPENGSKFEPLGSDSETNDGWNIHCAIIDELHAWKETHRGLFDVVETAMAKRRQPMRVIITTAGTDDSQLWIEEKDWSEQVVVGAQKQDDLFVYIAEIDRDRECNKCTGKGCEYCEKTGRIEVDPLDPAVWAQSNPMLNEPRPTCKIDEMQSLANKARVQPAAMNRFRRYYANQMIASYSSEYPAELWARGNLPLADLAGRRCFGGFDYGHNRDLAALALVFPFPELGEYHVKIWAWAPRDGVIDFSVDPWASFISSGALMVNDGDTVDPHEIYKVVEEIRDNYELASMAFDPSNAREFGTKCLNEYGIPIFSFPQNCQKYNEPMTAVSEALRNGKFRHGGDRLLSFAARNAVVRVDSMNRRMPHKPKSKGKIDPIVAMLMAFSEAKFAEHEPAESFEYEIWN